MVNMCLISLYPVFLCIIELAVELGNVGTPKNCSHYGKHLQTRDEWGTDISSLLICAVWQAEALTYT